MFSRIATRRHRRRTRAQGDATTPRRLSRRRRVPDASGIARVAGGLGDRGVQTHQSSRFAAWTLREAREETVARAGAANAALEPAKFALAPRTARTAVTEEVVRAAIFANKLEAWGMCA